MDSKNVFEPIRGGGWIVQIPATPQGIVLYSTLKSEYATDLKGFSIQSNMDFNESVCKEDEEENRYTPYYIRRLLKLVEKKACTS